VEGEASNRRQRIADALAIGAPVAAVLLVVVTYLRIAAEQQRHLVCDRLADQPVGVGGGASAILLAIPFVVTLLAVFLGTRRKWFAAVGLLFGVALLPLAVLLANLHGCHTGIPTYH